jgi:hypothetical protein
VAPKQGVGLHQGTRLALVHIFSFGLLCTHTSVLAQKSAQQVNADAHQAGMFQAFRVCLKQEKAAGKISAEDHRRCDLAAERLYFGLYNTDYAGRNSPISRSFVDEAQKVINAVTGDPGLCQSDTEFRKVGAAVVEDIKGYYPDHPDVSCGTADCPPAPYKNPFSDPNACWCNTPNFTPPSSCTSSQITQTWTPNSAWHGKPWNLPNLKIYTEYCYGRTMDGIMFLPQTTGVPTPPETLQSEPACDAKDVHIRQFVYSQCVDGYDCRTAEERQHGERPSYWASCRTQRYLNTWYLDECPSSEPHFLTPDSSIEYPNAVHVISDEPLVNLPDREGNPPIKKTFIDVVICGTNHQVLGAFTWMREGIKRPQTPQWCTKTGLLQTTQGPYTELRRLDPKSEDVSVPVCAVVNVRGFVPDPGLNAIVNNFDGCL